MRLFLIAAASEFTSSLQSSAIENVGHSVSTGHCDLREALSHSKVENSGHFVSQLN